MWLACKDRRLCGNRERAAARKTLVRPRTAAQAVAARGRDSRSRSDDLRQGSAAQGVEDGSLAGGNERRACLALCGCARPAFASRYLARRAMAGRWLLIEWPETEEAPAKFWLSTLPANTTLRDLGDTAKLRWRIERDFQDLKQEIGLDHYEGRGWRGFHHHAALSIAAYGFLVAERSPIPPSRPFIQAFFAQTPVRNETYRPRGGAAPA